MGIPDGSGLQPGTRLHSDANYTSGQREMQAITKIANIYYVSVFFVIQLKAARKGRGSSDDPSEQSPETCFVPVFLTGSQKIHDILFSEYRFFESRVQLLQKLLHVDLGFLSDTF